MLVVWRIAILACFIWVQLILLTVFLYPVWVPVLRPLLSATRQYFQRPLSKNPREEFRPPGPSVPQLAHYGLAQRPYTPLATVADNLIPKCQQNVAPIPVETGVNTMAILEKFLVLSRFMMHDLTPETQWMLSSGSLLGAYRHGKIMPWDIDGDIVTLDPNRFRALLHSRLEQAGMGNRFTFRVKPDGVVVMQINAPCAFGHAFHIDIVPFSYYYRHINLYFAVLQRCRCMLNDVELFCPDQITTQNYLRELFGNNYMTIDKTRTLNAIAQDTPSLLSCFYNSTARNIAF